MAAKKRYYVLRLRTVLCGLAVGVAAVIAVAAGITTVAVNGTAKATGKRKLPIYGVNTDEKVIALTFDCAWENSDTDRLMDILGRSGVKATFFATGDFCSRYPDDIKRIFSEGHDIQNHSYAHPHVEHIAPEKLTADTQKCDDIIEQLTGVRPTLYRAPYGEYSDSMLTVFEETLGHKVIQWDCDSTDWKKLSSQQMYERIMKKVKNGSILLFHNDTKNTPEALEMLIPRLQEDGYRFVLVRDMIYTEGYTLDHEGRQTR